MNGNSARSKRLHGGRKGQLIPRRGGSLPGAGGRGYFTQEVTFTLDSWERQESSIPGDQAEAQRT